MLNMPPWPKVPLFNPPKKRDLKEVKILLESLNNPHKKLPPTIHIAGTNGKGSSVAILRSIYENAGYKVHTYTSPHLLKFNERINLCSQNISDSHLLELLEEIHLKAQDLKIEPSFFEGITIAAFLAFSRVSADLLILETGMGGKFDATNVIDNPLLTIITPISFDHMAHLGYSLTEIASEKAGIIKSNVPCVISLQTQEVYDLLLSKCEKLNSPAFCYQYDYSIEKENQQLIYHSQKYSLALPLPSLLGKHQYVNTSAVLAAVMLLNNKFKVSNDNIAYGISNAKWPGRIEKIEYKKYPNVNIYLDGAHNEAGAKALAWWAAENFQEPVHLILGMTRNRDIKIFCQNFQGIICEGRAVKVVSEPSSYHPDVIVDDAKEYISLKSSNSLSEAIDDLYNKKALNIIITGSLFLISDFYNLVK